MTANHIHINEPQVAYPALNTALLHDLVRWAQVDQNLLDDPAFRQRVASWGHWDQGSWAMVTNPTDEDLAGDDLMKAIKNGVCETAYCMAGQAVTQAGYRLSVSEVYAGDSTAGVVACVPQVPTGEVDNRGNPVMRDVGAAVDIDQTATVILGLTATEADVLFDGDNSIDALKFIINGCCERRGLDKMFPESASASTESQNLYDEDDEDDEW